MKAKIYLSLLLLFVISCKKKNDTLDLNNLSQYLSEGSYAEGTVIACAASDKGNLLYNMYFYNQEGANNFRLFETDSLITDHKDYSKYTLSSTSTDPIFNGHLSKFSMELPTKEKWAIVTFELQNKIMVSNPVKLKYNSKGTSWLDTITIDHSKEKKPYFNWNDNAFGDNEIYFQVVSDSDNNLLSGTYTYDNFYQYYDTSNVVLNVTTKTPPVLISKDQYKCTVMDVSIDNWVNAVYEKGFVIP